MQDFARGERKIQVRSLGHDSNLTLGRSLITPYIMLADPGRAAGGANSRGENSYSCRFARSIRTKKAEDLSRSHIEIDAVESFDLRLGVFAGLASTGGMRPSRCRRRG
jgi:hypothetical protein